MVHWKELKQSSWEMLLMKFDSFDKMIGIMQSSSPIVKIHPNPDDGFKTAMENDKTHIGFLSTIIHNLSSIHIVGHILTTIIDI